MRTEEKRASCRWFDPAQIDGLLDAKKPPDRPGILRRIEDACRERDDDVALATIAPIAEPHSGRSSQ
jgi:hypothetical protein